MHAQRKFAQGQNVPQSILHGNNCTSATTASNVPVSSSTSSTYNNNFNNPSTSVECREAPTEILPNKKPKTEDFLTFLCFRGTRALPPHLDFLHSTDKLKCEKASLVAGDRKTAYITTNNKKENINKREDLNNITSTTTTSITTIASGSQENTHLPKSAELKKNIRRKSQIRKNHTQTINCHQTTGLVITPGRINSRRKGKKSSLEQKYGKCNVSNKEKNRSKNNNDENNVTIQTPLIEVEVENNDKSFENSKIISTGDFCNENQPTAIDDSRNNVDEGGCLKGAKSPKLLSKEQSQNKTDGDHNIETNETKSDEQKSTGVVLFDNSFVKNCKSINPLTPETTDIDNNRKPTLTDSTSLSILKATRNISNKNEVLNNNENNTDGKKNPKEHVTMATSDKLASGSHSTSNNKNSDLKDSLENDNLVVHNKTRKGNDNSSLSRKETLTMIKDINPPGSVNKMRQKEATIYIPPLEPSGRMTRQRAFFEPVKVQTNKKKSNIEDTSKTLNTNENAKKIVFKNKNARTIEQSLNDNSKSHVNLNVFDFSSDDEQPLAKSIKLGKNASATKKKNIAAKKKVEKITPDRNSLPRKGNVAVANSRGTSSCTPMQSELNKITQSTTKPVMTKNAKPQNKSDVMEKSKNETTRKRNKDVTINDEREQNNKAKSKCKDKRNESIVTNVKESAATGVVVNAKIVENLPDDAQMKGTTYENVTYSPRSKSLGGKQARKKIKLDVNAANDIENRNDDNSSNFSPVRVQRPSRKTKEAATIYMGIIGHRLQLGDDDDDDISLTSFDRPNVREMEKMENELKRNAAEAKQSNIDKMHKNNESKIPITTATVASTITSTASVVYTNVEKINSGRRGRPPKQKINTTNTTTTTITIPSKRDMVGMLVKKGTIDKLVDKECSKLCDAKDNVTLNKTDLVNVSSGIKNVEEEEDYLLNEELNETKRKLEKSFSDSDDEPLAIKANIKSNEKNNNNLETIITTIATTTNMPPSKVCDNLYMLPLMTKPTISGVLPTSSTSTNLASSVGTNMTISTGNIHNTSSVTAAASLSSKTTMHKTVDEKRNEEQFITSTTGNISNTSAAYNSPMVPLSIGNSSVASGSSNIAILNKYNTYSITQPQPSSLFPPTPSPSTTISSGMANIPTHYNAEHLTAQIRGVGLPPYNGGNSLNKSILIGGNIGAPTLLTTSSSTTACSALISTSTQLQNTNKYQTLVTTYPPPIEAYPSPKINPNFLTPKYDRNTLPRHISVPPPSSGISSNAFSSSSIKYDVAAGGISLVSSSCNNNINGNGVLLKNVPFVSQSNATSMSLGTNVAASGSIATVATVTLNSKLPYASGNVVNSSSIVTTNSTSTFINPALCCDPLRNEISGILAANLMPSKEESGKIFGIASVSLAQSSGPDNTKCTLGKCGSVHKPVLGPVVPTESYIGDQLSGKERRRAKVNMTHEQIHKWLIECSSNPDEIQDDLDDDFDSDLRPQNYSITPPPLRDDKESTSFSSSSKTTRDQCKSEIAWSNKGPSLKATPVIAMHNRKEELSNPEVADKISPSSVTFDKSNINKNSTTRNNEEKSTSRNDVKNYGKVKDDWKKNEDMQKQTMNNKELPEAISPVVNVLKTSSSNRLRNSTDSAVLGGHKKCASLSTSINANDNKYGRKQIATSTTNTTNVINDDGNHNTMKCVIINEGNVNNGTTLTNRSCLRRTPVYQQKQTRKVEEQNSNSNEGDNNDETITSGNLPFKKLPSKKSLRNAKNEASVYSFDKEDDRADNDDDRPDKIENQIQQSNSKKQQMLLLEDVDDARNNHLQRQLKRNSSQSMKRLASTVTEKVNKDISSSQMSSVSLTLSPGEKSKLVKVSLESEVKLLANSGVNNMEGTENAGTSKATKSASRTVETIVPQNDNESDSGDGHTFYIPLQSIGTGNDNENDIQGVAVKLDREGPEGPNQKVIMHATLVTKAKLGPNSKQLPESMNVSDIVKNVIVSEKKCASSTNSASNSLKNVPVGTVQPRFKEENVNATVPVSSAHLLASASSGDRLVRVNSNSSLHSGSAKSRNATVPIPTQQVTSSHSNTNNRKLKSDVYIKMSNNTAFPRHDDPTQMVEAPIFRPTESEFSDPIEFIERITPIAARFGICKIIPPTSFKPECRISDEMRFTAYNQYIHKMLYRWGPSAKELSAIKKYLATQSIAMTHAPWIGGMEVDLPRLYHTVQELGGLKEVIEKKKWARVAEEMCIPKLAQDRVTKLDDIYCKYLLPYDTLSPSERQKLFDEVEADWAKREARARRNADRFVNTESVSNEEGDMSSENDEEESEEETDGVSMECIVKGRSMPLSQFYRIARNTMALWFKNSEPTVNEVEAEFWRHVAVRDSHVCVHSGSIDSSGWGFGFPTPGPKGKGSNYSRHLWNLKVLTNNPGSMLRSLGPVMGVTVPTLHVGMLFSACCWYRDPHGLSWIEYLHTGASKLWYGIPDDQSSNFRAALTSLIPTHCQNKTIWLPCDTVMIPPHMLTDRGVSLCRIEQRPGEFIVVFPRAYTSSLATGYVVSESVYFAASSWLDYAKEDFRVRKYLYYIVSNCFHIIIYKFTGYT